MKAAFLIAISSFLLVTFAAKGRTPFSERAAFIIREMEKEADAAEERTREMREALKRLDKFEKEYVKEQGCMPIDSGCVTKDMLKIRNEKKIR